MFGLNVTKRQEPPRWGSFFIYPACILISLGISSLLLALQGKPALTGMLMLWQGAFGASYAIEDTILKMVPIFLCSLGVAVTFRMQVWNIGAEGQFALGAVGGTWAAITFPQLPAWQLLPLMFFCSAVAGGLWALIPAYLKTKLQVNEIITTLMFNYIGISVLEYLVYGPWKAAASFGFPMTDEFSEAAIIGAIPGTRLHWGVLVCVACGVMLHVFLNHSRLGFELKASGESFKAAHYAKIPYKFLVLLVMAICGALAGWAGMIETSAVVNRLQPSIMVGYGFTAVVVAWLARLNPLGIAFASLFLAALRVGVENLMLELQVPAAFGGIMEGLILLTVIAGQFFMSYKIKFRSGEVSK